jgi:hypothetical protein
MESWLADEHSAKRLLTPKARLAWRWLLIATRLQRSSGDGARGGIDGDHLTVRSTLGRAR